MKYLNWYAVVGGESWGPSQPVTATPPQTDASGQFTLNWTLPTTLTIGSRVLVYASAGTGYSAEAEITVVGAGMTPTPAPTPTPTPTPGPPSADRSAVTAPQGTAALANGQSAILLLARLQDSAGTPLVGKVVVFRSSRNTVTQTVDVISAVTDRGNGVYTAQLSSSTPGVAFVIAEDTTDHFLIPGVVRATFAGPVDPSVSGVVAVPAGAPADGLTPITVTVRLADRQGDPVPGQSVTVSSSRNSGGSVVDLIGPVVDQGDGSYTARVTSRTAGQATLTASVGSLTFQTTAVFNAVVSAQLSTVRAHLPGCVGWIACEAGTSIVVPADSASVPVVVELRDINGKPVPGRTVVLGSSRNTSSGTPDSIVQPTDQGDGRYIGSVASQTGGVATITAVDQTDGITLTAALAITFGPDPAHSSLVATPARVPGDGRTPLTITLTLRDGNGKGLAGQAPQFEVSQCIQEDGQMGTPTLSAVIDHGDGTYTATATANGGCRKAIWYVSPYWWLRETWLQAGTFVGPVNALWSSVTLSAAEAQANGRDVITVTVNLQDSQSSPVTGQVVTMATSRQAAGDQVSPVTELGNGFYRVTLRSTTPGTACLDVRAGSVRLSTRYGWAPCVQFIGPAALSQSYVSVQGYDQPPSLSSCWPSCPPLARADGQHTVTVWVTLRDATGGPVSGKRVVITSSRNNGSTVVDTISTPLEHERFRGYYTATIASTTPGMAVLTVTDETDGETLPEHPLVIFWSPTSAIAGRLLDPQGQPIAQGEVFAQGDGGVRYRAPTAADGTYTIQGLSPGMVYWVGASVPVEGFGQFHAVNVSLWYRSGAAGVLSARQATPVTATAGTVSGIDIRVPSLTTLARTADVEIPDDRTPDRPIPIILPGDREFRISFDPTKEPFWGADFTLTYPDGFTTTVTAELASVVTTTTGIRATYTATVPIKEGPSPILVQAALRSSGVGMSPTALTAAAADTPGGGVLEFVCKKGRNQIIKALVKEILKRIGGPALVDLFEKWYTPYRWVTTAWDALSWLDKEINWVVNIYPALQDWNHLMLNTNHPEATIPDDVITFFPNERGVEIAENLALFMAFETRDLPAGDPNKFTIPSDQSPKQLFYQLHLYLSGLNSVYGWGIYSGQLPDFLARHLEAAKAIIQIWSVPPPAGQNSVSPLADQTKASWPCPGGADRVATFAASTLVDPSGIVTDRTTGQPVAGATATLLAEDPTTGRFAPAPTQLLYPPVNPQTTDAQGHYGWEVPPGVYKVLVTAPGYQEVATAPIVVPPPRMDVNFALQSAPFQYGAFLPLVMRTAGW
ncbi:MAG: Ig-like domain-containing protein [Chloroflexi bacterium]|nr:Ig-like domain-containing protein [Chloroflexota bacterium]